MTVRRRWRRQRDHRFGFCSCFSLLCLLGLPLAIGLPVNRDDLGVMREPINEGDGTRSIRKDGLRSGGSTAIPIPTPILGDSLFMITSSGVGGKRPLFVVRPGAQGDLTLKEGESSNASVVWSRDARFLSTPIVYRGVLYVLADNGVFDAYDLKTGQEIYRQRLPDIGSGFSASPVAADGKIYLSNEDGHMRAFGRSRMDSRA